VKKVQEHIAQGWVYQVNACREISTDVEVDNLRGLFSLILEKNPAPGLVTLKLQELILHLHRLSSFLSAMEIAFAHHPLRELPLSGLLILV